MLGIARHPLRIILHRFRSQHVYHIGHLHHSCKSESLTYSYLFANFDLIIGLLDCSGLPLHLLSCGIRTGHDDCAGLPRARRHSNRQPETQLSKTGDEGHVHDTETAIDEEEQGLRRPAEQRPAELSKVLESVFQVRPQAAQAAPQLPLLHLRPRRRLHGPPLRLDQQLRRPQQLPLLPRIHILSVRLAAAVRVPAGD